MPVSELSLIAFPTRELFVDKIDQFDLIIFDRYRRRGILPSAYLDNVKDYVEKGGAVLVEAGPEFGSADSLWRSPLADILPVTPSSRVLVAGLPARDHQARRTPPGDRGAGGLRTAGPSRARPARLGPLVPPDRDARRAAARW